MNIKEVVNESTITHQFETLELISDTLKDLFIVCTNTESKEFVDGMPGNIDLAIKLANLLLQVDQRLDSKLYMLDNVLGKENE